MSCLNKCMILVACLLVAACGNNNSSVLHDSTEDPNRQPVSNEQKIDLINKYVEIIQNPDRFRVLTIFAEMIGFGWTFGCPLVSGWEGEGNKSFKINQDTSDMAKCFAEDKGFRDKDRASYKLYDFEVTVEDIIKGEEEPSKNVIDAESSTIYTSVNKSSENSSEASISYTKDKRNTLTTTTNSTLNAGGSIKLSASATVKAEAGFLGSGGSVSATVGTDITTQLSKSMSKGRSELNWESDSFSFSGSVPVPPCTKKTIRLNVFSEERRIPFKAKVKVSSKLDISGFLKYKFHGNRHHGNDRPTITTSFGSKSQSFTDRILSDVKNNHIVWDWQKIHAQHPADRTDREFFFYRSPLGLKPTFQQVLDYFSTNKYAWEGEVEGSFLLKNQVRVETEILRSEPLPAEECSAGGGQVVSELP